VKVISLVGDLVEALRALISVKLGSGTTCRFRDMA